MTEDILAIFMFGFIAGVLFALFTIWIAERLGAVELEEKG